MDRSLAGRVALVTGASSGIGAATARKLLAAGARVVVTARRIERLQQMGHALAAGPDQWRAIAADIRQDADAERLIAETVAWTGGLDVLINNAGLSRGNLHETAKAADLRLMVDTNLYALANLTRLAIPALKKSQGDIVNISSTAATSLVVGAAYYAATKAGVATFSEILRKELCNDGVRVMTILPGLVRTEFFDHFEGEKKQRLGQMMDAVQALSSDDLADAVLFMVTRPTGVNINELIIRPTRQA